MTRCDILVTGTGSLAEVALFTFATTSVEGKIRLAVGGRNEERGRWLTLAANARSAAFGLPNFTEDVRLDWETPETLSGALDKIRPRVIVQTASMQSPWALAQPNAWSALVREGGYGLGTPFHTILTARLVKAVEMLGLDTIIINGAYPDIANSIIKSMGLPVPIGFGNLDIVAAAISAVLGVHEPGFVRMLAQWEPHVADFREPPEHRRNIEPRLWLGGEEVSNVMERFREIKFPPASDDSLNQVTGTLVVPMALAFLQGCTYHGHAAGPFGLPGGYPVRVENKELSLDLPAGVTTEEAAAFNKSFEELEGVILDEQTKQVALVGKARAALKKHSSRLADGYRVTSIEDLEKATSELLKLRERLSAQSVA